MLNILLVDDEPTILASLSDALRADGHRVHLAQDGTAAAKALANEAFDLLICDLRLPKGDGMSVFRYARVHAPKTDVVLITAFGAVSEAVAALKEGAADYLTKPFRLDELRARVDQINRGRRLRQDLALAQASLRDSQTERIPIIGRSLVLKQALERIETFGDSEYPVLVTGESGTGKELVARRLHDSSPRRKGPLIAVNCAAFPETLIEAELYGYKRGAFTGAFQDRQGRFRAAHGGTLFLDEVAEMPLAAQAKLLRVLQEGHIEPLGTNEAQEVDVRIISATHRDLRERVAAGVFREDLYYRLKVLSIEVPPLRERLGDVPVLVEHFLNAAARGGHHPAVSAQAMAALQAYAFPGNVRELEHAIQHAAVLARWRDIELDHLPSEIAGAQSPLLTPPHREKMVPLAVALAQFERDYIVRALAQVSNHRTRAAAVLDISRKNLWQKLRRHGLLQQQQPISGCPEDKFEAPCPPTEAVGA